MCVQNENWLKLKNDTLPKCWLCFMYNMSKIDHQQTLPGYENSTCPFTLTSGLACKTSGNLKPVTHFSFFYNTS